jgi:hypothetical protein
VKLSDLMDVLSQYDPETDVLIAAKPSGTYFEFEIKQQTNHVMEGGSALVTLEPTELAGSIEVTAQE